MPIFWSFGAEMFDASGRPAVNSPEGISALRFMIELGKYAPSGYASFNASEDGLAGIQQLAHDTNLLFYGSEEAQEGRDAYREKRKPDFGRFPKRP